jgi:hypothetical protein
MKVTNNRTKHQNKHQHTHQASNGRRSLHHRANPALAVALWPDLCHLHDKREPWSRYPSGSLCKCQLTQNLPPTNQKDRPLSPNGQSTAPPFHRGGCQRTCYLWEMDINCSGCSSWTAHRSDCKREPGGIEAIGALITCCGMWPWDFWNFWPAAVPSPAQTSQRPVW